MSKLFEILAEAWAVLGAMAPSLLFGFLVAGILSIFLSARMVERHLGGRGPWPVLKGAFWGVPMPLCSCSVIPVAASLRRHGAGGGATTAFLLSTPQTGVDSIFVTYSLLGPVFAVFRPLAAFVTGLFGGYLVDAFGGKDAGGGRVERCEEECCLPTASAPGLVRALRYGFVTLPRDIGKELLIGLAVAGVITALTPPDLFAGVLGPGPVQMLVMMALGIPVYVCATASVPIAAALIAQGVSPGAAFVFLMTGPATNAATVLMLRKLLGWKSAVIYLGTIVAAALGGGVVLDRLFSAAGMTGRHAGHGMLPEGLETAAAVALLGVLGFALFGPRPRAHATPAEGADCACHGHGTGEDGCEKQA